jgi:hypothetical protein
MSIPISLHSQKATAENMKQFYPEMTCSFQAWAVDIDGVCEGVIGMALTRPYRCIFATFSDTLRPHLKSVRIMKLVKKLHDEVAKSRMPVRAIRQCGERKAVHILKRLGFEFECLCDGDAVYIYGGK